MHFQYFMQYSRQGMLPLQLALSPLMWTDGFCCTTPVVGCFPLMSSSPARLAARLLVPVLMVGLVVDALMHAHHLDMLMYALITDSLPRAYNVARQL